MVLFILIVSLGLAGVLAAFNTSVRHSADPMVRKQVLLTAEAMMNEILLRSYQNDPADAANTSATLGCTASTPILCRPNTPSDRANYNDVDDYNGFSQTGIKQVDGVTPVVGLESYTLSVAVDNSAATLGGLTAAGNQIKKITVTVTGGAETITLTAYRANYE
jgi:MSHA pilin protein MshD